MSDWNAESYERVSDPQVGWAVPVLDRLALRGDETVIDAGCGTGRVTRLLAERLPRGRVIAVDGSPAMVAEATERLADLAHVRVRRSDLLELEVEERVDAIVSTATFHWVLDHATLFTRLRAALVRGGRLVAQCGGAGNIARVIDTARAVGRLPSYSPHLTPFRERWRFAEPDETAGLLRAAGFADTRTWLEDAPVDLPDPSAGAEFLATVVLRHHLELLPDELRRPFACAVADRLADDDGRVRLDYVRLNMECRAAGA